MAYNKKTDYFKWKADCLIGGFKRRHKKYDLEYTYITKRVDYAKIVEKKLKGNCEYCGVKLTRKNLSVDHKIPLSRGGNTSEENLAYCCDKCNNAKGEMDYEEYVALISLIKTWSDKGKYILSKLRAGSLMFKRPRRF